jgi:hypothetical protein
MRFYVKPVKDGIDFEEAEFESHDNGEGDFYCATCGNIIANSPEELMAFLKNQGVKFPTSSPRRG